MEIRVSTIDGKMGAYFDKSVISKISNLNEKKKPYKHKSGFDDKLGKDPFGLNQYARELMEEFQIEDIKPAAKSLEEQKEVRIFTKNCDCDKT